MEASLIERQIHDVEKCKNQSEKKKSVFSSQLVMMSDSDANVGVRVRRLRQ